METTEIINSLKTTDIINCIVGIIGLIASIIAICISISNSKRQYKIELFNKRIRYYYACEIICTFCMVDMQNSVQGRFDELGIDINQFDVDGAKFLFESDTAEFICDIFSKWTYFGIIEYYLKNYDSSANKDDEEFEEKKKIYDETQLFFSEARKQLVTKFEKYLKITK